MTRKRPLDLDEMDQLAFLGRRILEARGREERDDVEHRVQHLVEQLHDDGVALADQRPHLGISRYHLDRIRRRRVPVDRAPEPEANVRLTTTRPEALGRASDTSASDDIELTGTINDVAQAIMGGADGGGSPQTQVVVCLGYDGEGEGRRDFQREAKVVQTELRGHPYTVEVLTTPAQLRHPRPDPALHRPPHRPP